MPADLVPGADARLQHSLCYASSTSDIKDDFPQLISCLVRNSTAVLPVVVAVFPHVPLCRCRRARCRRVNRALWL